MSDFPMPGELARQPTLVQIAAPCYVPAAIDYSLFGADRKEDVRIAAGYVGAFACMPIVLDDFASHRERRAWRDAQERAGNFSGLATVALNALRANHVGSLFLHAQNLSINYLGPSAAEVAALAFGLERKWPKNYDRYGIRRKIGIVRDMQADARCLLDYFAKKAC
jgi:hypothetical protein